jgi:hypothetical protein
MFYLRDWLENSEESKRFADEYGYQLKVPDTWEQLDAMMAFFHRPEQGKYGGALPNAVLHCLGVVGKISRQGLLPVRQ